MKQTVLKIDGMMCGMCESHINDAIRRAFPVKKVTSSHARGETVILSEADIPQEALQKVMDATGYRLLSVETRLYEKKRLFSRH